MEVLARHTIDNLAVTRPAEGEPSRVARLREQLSWVAVPMGKCSEPTNVRAGGQACPIRYQCAGCPHFDSDPSYLPELQSYADGLRRQREAMLAVGAADWAVEGVARQLGVMVDHIQAHEQTLGRLPGDEREVIDQASATFRKARQSVPVAFGRRGGEGVHGRQQRRPATRPTTRQPDQAPAGSRRRPRHGTDRRTISFPAVARRAGVSVSMLYADRLLTAQIAEIRDRQRQAGRDRAWRLPARSLVSEQGLRTELANTKEQARRLAQEVKVFRDRLERQLGSEADLARGQTLSPLLDKLEQRAADLEADNIRQSQRIAHLEAETRELTDTLDAARAMNRQLTGCQWSRPAPAAW